MHYAVTGAALCIPRACIMQGGGLHNASGFSAKNLILPGPLRNLALHNAAVPAA